MEESLQNYEEFGEVYEVVRTVDAFIGDKHYRIEINKSYSGPGDQVFSARGWVGKTLPAERFDPADSNGFPWSFWVRQHIHLEHCLTAESALRMALSDLAAT
jgi:hypothetical protein